MLELADNAVTAIKELTETGGLRFVAKEGEGGSYSFDPSVEEQPEEGDQVVERDGARVFLDALAAEKLADQILEIESHGDHLHMDFVPQGGDDEDADSDDSDDADDDADDASS
jgi:Fe-S cluster assembly iron-binding protein IscA